MFDIFLNNLINHFLFYILNVFHIWNWLELEQVLDFDGSVRKFMWLCNDLLLGCSWNFNFCRKKWKCCWLQFYANIFGVSLISRQVFLMKCKFFKPNWLICGFIWSKLIEWFYDLELGIKPHFFWKIKSF